jgi:hypothetical protein
VIYLAFYVFRAALLIALPIVWLGGLYLLAKVVSRHFSIGAIVYATAAAIAVAPFAWIGYAWYSFKVSCSGFKPLTQFSSIDRQKSILLRLDLGFDFGKDTNMQVGSILGRDGPVCIEKEFWRPVTSPQTGETFRFERSCPNPNSQLGREYTRSNELISRYAVTVNAVKDFNELGYLLTYRVEETKAGQVIAEAGEAVFGRGLLGQYIGLLSGSNNPEYLACGYVDHSPRIWRSTRVSMGHPEYEAYKAVDQKLLEIAVGHTNAR